MAAILATASEEVTVRWFAAEGSGRAPRSLPGARYSFPGIRLPAAGAEPVAGAWELAPVDGEFLSEYAPQDVAERAFDKLAFRTGWGEADQYVLLEGVGGQAVPEPLLVSLGSKWRRQDELGPLEVRPLIVVV